MAMKLIVGLIICAVVFLAGCTQSGAPAPSPSTSKGVIAPEYRDLLKRATVKDWKELSFAKKVGLTTAAATSLHPELDFDPSTKRAAHYFHALNRMAEDGTVEDEQSVFELIETWDTNYDMAS